METTFIIFISVVSFFGFIYLIKSIKKSIRFHRGLKVFKNEILPEMAKKGLITKEDIDKIKNTKLPDIF